MVEGTVVKYADDTSIMSSVKTDAELDGRINAIMNGVSKVVYFLISIRLYCMLTSNCTGGKVYKQFTISEIIESARR